MVQHENKYIDYGTESNTGVYSDFQKDLLNLRVFHEEFKKNHRDKMDGLDMNIPYDDMFRKK